MGRKASPKNRNTNLAKKKALAEQAVPFFQSHGLRAITMDEVAQYIGKSKATIYKYFSTKEEIISLVISNRLAIIKQFELILHNTDLPYLDRYTNSVQHLYAHIGDISNLFLADLKALYPHLWQSINAFIDYVGELLRAYYTEGIHQKVFKPIHPSILVLSDSLFLNALSDPDFLIPNNLSLQQAYDQYFTLKFTGIIYDAHLPSK